MLAIANTIMTAGILVGVWVGVLRTDTELRDAMDGINRFIKEKLDKGGK